MRRPTIAATLLLTALIYPSWAQSPAEHEADHPQQQNAAPAATQTAPTAGQSGMGQGMMGGGMVNMMGGNMPMMNMMQMMGSRQANCGMGGMGTIDRIEGRNRLPAY